MTDGDRRMQARAVFLAAIMVVSMLAVPMAFAGGAAASEDPSATFDFDDFDGETFLRGEDTVNETTITLDGLDDDTNYTVRMNVTDPDGDTVDLTEPDDIEINSLELDGIAEFEIQSEGDAYYLNETRNGTVLDGEIDGELDVSVADDATFGTYDLEATVVEWNQSEIDGGEVVEEIDDTGEATVEVGGGFEVDIEDTNEPLFESQGLNVSANVTYVAESGNDSTDVNLTVDGNEVASNDTENIDANDSEVVWLNATAGEIDAGTYDAVVNTTTHEDSVEVTIDPDPEVEPDRDSVREDDEVVVDVTVDNHPEDVTADFVVEANDSAYERTGDTDDGTFSFLADPQGQDLTAGDQYNITVTYGDYDDAEFTATVEILPVVDLDVTLDPAEPVFGDDLLIDGTFTDEEGDRPAEYEALNVTYEDEETVVTELDVSSSGTVNSLGDTFEVDDAGEFHIVFVTDQDREFTLETFNVSEVEADLTGEFEDNNRAFNEETYNFTLVDHEDEPLNVTEGASEGVAGYINVTGPFNETDLDDQTSVVYASEDGEETAYVHLETDDNGTATLNATPLDIDSVDAAVATYDGEEFDGLEDVDGFESFETPDYVADPVSLNVDPLDDLNVDIDVEPDDQLSVNASVNEENEVSVSVIGSDNEAPGDDNAIEQANVTLSSEDYDIDETLILNESDSGPAVFDDALRTALDEAGSVTIDVVAYNTTDLDEVVGEFNETLDVDGDVLVDFTPDSATVDDEVDVTIELTDADGDDVTDRDLNLSGSALDESVELGGGNLVALGPSTYVAENVTFDNVGTVNLTVSDDDRYTIDAEDVIEVTGDERFEFRTDDDLLVTDEEDVSLEVYNLEEEAIENDSDTLQELADNLELTQDGDAIEDFGDVSVDDADNGTLLVEDVLVDSTDVVNVSSSTEDALEASGEIGVVEPVVETDLGDDLLTEGVTTEDVTVTVTDPRDDSPVDNGTVEFVANGTDFDINGTGVDDGNETEFDLDADGEVVVNVTPDAIDDAANTTLAIAAQAEDAATLGFYGDIDVDADNLQLFEREDGEDVELREEIEFDSEEDITFILRDANDARLDERDVNVTGAGVDIETTTDEGFFSVDFAEEDLEQGEEIDFDVSADADFDDVNVATIEVTEDLEEVELTLTVENDTVTQGDDLEFSVVRGDFGEETRADLTFVNESGEGEEVLTVGTGGVDTADYGVVDTSDLEADDYEVEATKPDSTTKTFLPDTVTVTVEEPDVPAVSIEDQESDGDSVVVESAYSPDEDFVVVIHNESDGDDVAGWSGDLDAGETYENLEIDLDVPLEEDQNVTAMLHETDEDDDFGAAITMDGEPVQDTAFVTIVEEVPAFFEVDDLEAPETVNENETFEVSAVVTNTGDVTDTQNITLSIDGDEEASQEVTLDADENETVTFEDVSIAEEGEYELEVASANDSATAMITVEEVDIPEIVIADQPATDTTGDGLLNDIDGDGEFTIFDVQLFFQELNSDEIQDNVEFFDFAQDGNVDIFDVQALFNQLQDQDDGDE